MYSPLAAFLSFYAPKGTSNLTFSRCFKNLWIFLALSLSALRDLISEVDHPRKSVGEERYRHRAEMALS